MKPRIFRRSAILATVLLVTVFSLFFAFTVSHVNAEALGAYESSIAKKIGNPNAKNNYNTAMSYTLNGSNLTVKVTLSGFKTTDYLNYFSVTIHYDSERMECTVPVTDGAAIEVIESWPNSDWEDFSRKVIKDDEPLIILSGVCSKSKDVCLKSTDKLVFDLTFKLLDNAHEIGLWAPHKEVETQSWDDMYTLLYGRGTYLAFHTKSSADAYHVFTKKVQDAAHLCSKATCTQSASYYYECELCGAISTNSTYTAGNPLGHTGGTATCQSPKKCTRCGQFYGSKDATNHTGGTTITGKTDADCTHDGFSGNTVCNGCGTVLTSGRTIKALGHTGGTATCTSPKKCTRCGQNYGDKNPSNHVGGTTVSGKKTADCTHDGYTGDTVCGGCKAVINAGKVEPALGHTGGTADCMHGKICDRCRVEYTEKDMNNHLNKVVSVPGKPATCTEDGYTEIMSCSACGTSVVESTVIPATGHAGGIATCIRGKICAKCGAEYGEKDAHNHAGDRVKGAPVNPTFTTRGHVGDIMCSACNAVIEKGEITSILGDLTGDGIMNALDYFFLKRVVLKTATCTEAQWLAGDLKSDGMIDSRDYIALKRKILKA